MSAEVANPTPLKELAEEIAAEHGLPAPIAMEIAQQARLAVAQFAPGWKLTQAERNSILGVYVAGFVYGRRITVYGRN